MSLSAVAAIILVAGGLIACILGVAELSPGAIVGGLAVIRRAFAIRTGDEVL